jgi:1-acyl-sn-glycerol-3-phosphate acyltransferase
MMMKQSCLQPHEKCPYFFFKKELYEQKIARWYMKRVTMILLSVNHSKKVREYTVTRPESLYRIMRCNFNLLILQHMSHLVFDHGLPQL